MDVEYVFSSKLRIIIMKVLSQVGELNVSDIARRLGASFSTTSKHLEILEEEGILQHKRFGRIRLYRINEQSIKAKAVQNLLDVWEQTGLRKN